VTAVLLTALGSAHTTEAATFQVFTTRASFQAVAGSGLGSQDFSNGAPPVGSAFNITTGTVSNGVFSDEGLPGVFGTSNTDKLFRFGPTTTAFGADWDLSPGGNGGGLVFTALFADGTTQRIGVITNPQGSTYVGFWGFVSDTPVAAVQYQGGNLTGNSESFNMDNASFRLAPPHGMILGFDALANGTAIDTVFLGPLGVTFSNGSGSIYANSYASAPSAPNVVSPALGVTAFDVHTGAVHATLIAPVSSIGVDLLAFNPGPAGPQGFTPFLQAYDASGHLIGEVHYDGPQPAVGSLSPMETLTITEPGNTIQGLAFSAENFGGGVTPTYGIFDNVSFAAAVTPPLVEHFDAEAGASGVYSAFANWKVTRGSVDLVAQGAFGLGCFGSTGKCIDMDGGTNIAGRIETIVPYDLVPGTYNLSFALSGNQRGFPNDSITVSLGNISQSLYSETFTLASGDPWRLVSRSITVTARTSAKLVFDLAGGFGTSDNVGILLDEINLAQQPAPPVPALPRSLGLALAGIFAFAGLALSRKRNVLFD
jgi:hypothetical protein